MGCARSGTALLRDLLRAHSDLSFPPESHLLPALYAVHGNPPDARAARRLAADLLGSFRFAQWKLGLEPSQLQHHRSFGAMVDELYSTRAAREGKRRWGDKTPGYVNHLDAILEMFPAAQVICMVRDGRDVCLSLVRQPWGPANAYGAALTWREAITSGRRAATRLAAETFLEVRYERLTTTLEPELRRICDFLGEEFEDSMLSPHRAATRPHPNARPREFDDDVIPGNFGKWRTAMSEDDVNVFETVAGDELVQCGYELAGTPQQLSIPRRVIWQARSTVKWLRWRLISQDRLGRARTTLRITRSRLTTRRGATGTP